MTKKPADRKLKFVISFSFRCSKLSEISVTKTLPAADRKRGFSVIFIILLSFARHILCEKHSAHTQHSIFPPFYHRLILFNACFMCVYAHRLLSLHFSKRICLMPAWIYKILSLVKKFCSIYAYFIECFFFFFWRECVRCI